MEYIINSPELPDELYHDTSLYNPNGEYTNCIWIRCIYLNIAEMVLQKIY